MDGFAPSLGQAPPFGAAKAGLTPKPHHAQQPRVALRGSFRLRLASTCRSRSGATTDPHAAIREYRQARALTLPARSACCRPSEDQAHEPVDQLLDWRLVGARGHLGSETVDNLGADGGDPRGPDGRPVRRSRFHLSHTPNVGGPRQALEPTAAESHPPQRPALRGVRPALAATTEAAPAACRARPAAASVAPVVATSSITSSRTPGSGLRDTNSGPRARSARERPVWAAPEERTRSRRAGRPSSRATARARSSAWSKPRSRALARVVGGQVTASRDIGPAPTSARTAPATAAASQPSPARALRYLRRAPPSPPA